MKDNRAFSGWFIPVELVQAYGLSYLEAFIWSEIYALSRRSERCTASNEHFMAQFEKSERCIQSILAKLRFKGLVSNISFDGRVRRMVALCPWAQAGYKPKDEQIEVENGHDSHLRGAEICTPQVSKNAPLGGPPYMEKETVEGTHPIDTRTPSGRKQAEPTDPGAPIQKARNLTFEALAELEGWHGGPIPAGAWRSKIGKCVKEAKEFCPDLSDVELASEVKRRSSAYREKWPNVSITATALLKHWMQFGVDNQPPERIVNVFVPSSGLLPGETQRDADIRRQKGRVTFIRAKIATMAAGTTQHAQETERLGREVTRLNEMEAA